MFPLIALIIGLIVGIFVWLTINWAISFPSKKIPVIYKQPGFWYPLKYAVFRLMLLARKFQNRRQQQSKSRDSVGQNSGYGIKSRISPDEMERIQTFPENEPLAVDAVYFNGGNEDGVFFVAATARRPHNAVQTVLFIRLPNVGLLELPSLPDTWIVDQASQSQYSASGLTLTPLEPMKLWQLSYSGPMRLKESNGKIKTVEVSFDLEWKANTDYFDFDTDLHPHTMADSIAKEKWSREYFDALKKSHQTHYEQFGEITGTVYIDDDKNGKGNGKKGAHEISAQGVRDHSYGNVRNWKYFHRYAINYAYLQDGTAICVGAISMPISLSRFVIGYVIKPNGSMAPVTSSSFELYDWGEDGTTPGHMTIDFVAGGDKYSLECDVIEAPVFYMGQGREWDAKIHERFCAYKVNGVTGWGISEWDYRNYDGKDVEMKRFD